MHHSSESYNAPKMKKPEEKFSSVSQPHHERSNNAILSWRRQQKMDGCSRNIDLVHFGTQKMPGKIGYCLKSGLAQYSSFIITMGLSFARYHLTRGDDPNFWCVLISPPTHNSPCPRLISPPFQIRGPYLPQFFGFRGPYFPHYF